MDAAALVKLLFLSLAMVGFVRLIVIVFIGDVESDPAICRMIHAFRRLWRDN